MRRPGTLPAANNHLSSVGGQQRTGATGIFCSSPQTPVNELSNGTASLRSHHPNHSLRRSHQNQSPAPALPARADSSTAERHHHQQQNNSRLQNGAIPDHPPPPPRHSPPCPQSSYPTLQVNGHVVPHHYRHYRGDRDRSRDRSLSRDRQDVIPVHRGDNKHRDNTLELEVHEDDSSNGIGTYRA